MSLVGCGNPSYVERLRDGQREASEFFCPCDVTGEVFENESECVTAYESFGEAYATCIEPVYNNSSDTERGVFDCYADESEAESACAYQSTCSDEENLERCLGAANYARCGSLSEETQNALTTCTELLEI